MRGKHWTGLIILSGAVALAAWLLWPEAAREQRELGLVNVVAPLPPSSSTTPVSPPGVGARKLVGTWSLRDNRGDVRAACDLFSAVTYLSGGQYFSNGETGRYAADATSVTYSAKILIDMDAGEDRSQFDVREILPMAWNADHAVRIGKRQFYRCEKCEP